MADPLSVAGSAVGIISLGLTVSQGLLAYYGPFKAYDEQIQDVSCRITSFNNILKTLEDVIADARIPSSTLTTRSANVALDCIFNCQEGLERLENMLDKCQSSPSRKSFLGSKINRMLYPFRRDTLVTLLGTMSQLQEDLNTSLHSLTMAMIVSSQQQMGSVITSSTLSAPNTSQMLSIASTSDPRVHMIECHVKQMQDDNNCVQILADLLIVALDDSDARSFEPYKNHLGAGIAGILRFITLESLDLTHTCCHGGGRIECEDIKEIHDEERSGILDLDDLLKQLLEDFEGQNIDLPTFITGPWRTHMDSFLSSRTLSAEEISQVRETGVILYE